MGKNKIRKFSENETFRNLVQPELDEVLNKDYHLKGKWNKEFFKNEQPLVLELGCGKGEYTIGLAQNYTEKNFLGVDIKGARLWRGAKTGIEKDLYNAGFLRTRIEFIESLFVVDEVDEIWVTFPDPQLKKRRNKKRLTGSAFLNKYCKILKHNGIVHLKTDNRQLYEYTLSLVKFNNIEPEIATDDLYNSEFYNEILSIKTHYENLFFNEGHSIKYLKFRLQNDVLIEEMPEEDEEQ